MSTIAGLIKLQISLVSTISLIEPFSIFNSRYTHAILLHSSFIRDLCNIMIKIQVLASASFLPTDNRHTYAILCSKGSGLKKVNSTHSRAWTARTQAGSFRSEDVNEVWSRVTTNTKMSFVHWRVISQQLADIGMKTLEWPRRKVRLLLGWKVLVGRQIQWTDTKKVLPQWDKVIAG